MRYTNTTSNVLIHHAAYRGSEYSKENKTPSVCSLHAVTEIQIMSLDGTLFYTTEH